MRVLIELEVTKQSGPFRSAEALAEAAGDELTGTTLDVDGSEYEVETCVWWGPADQAIRKDFQRKKRVQP